jgi:hypothetical protein
MWLLRLRHWAASLFIGAAALVYLIEEWLWDALKRAMGLLGRAPGLKQLERWVAGLPPAGAAFFFVLPASLALPVKLIALKWIATGRIVAGTAVIIAAKILATALFARIYVLTQPALMRVRWFVALHAGVLRWRVWAYAQIESHPAWRAIRRRILQWRASVEAAKGRRGRWSRRWRAVQRLDRIRRARAAGAWSAGTR